jgi:hypothetical protein
MDDFALLHEAMFARTEIAQIVLDARQTGART